MTCEGLINHLQGDLMKRAPGSKYGMMLGLSLALTLGLSSSGWAQDQMFAGAQAECLAGGQALNINNDAVLGWKANSKNQYRNRAHIEGTLGKVYGDQSGHHHYSVQIGPKNSDTVEVIYNEAFGAVAPAQPGAKFEACGDYITSNAPAGGYPVSPDGALVHWVHRSPDPGSHDSGFIMIDGQLYGQDTSKAGPHKPRGHGKHGNGNQGNNGGGQP